MSDVTPLPHLDVIRNPGNAAHFMAMKPLKQRIRVYAGDTLLADTLDAIRLIEVGRDVYDPLVYVPAGDVTAELKRLDKSSHCPLKGDASYHAYRGVEIAWSYDAPLDFARDIAGRHAFWPAKVRIEEGE